jgi:hypothetical protein
MMTAGTIHEHEIQVPVFLSGTVTKNDGVDFCMDGASFKLQTVPGSVRLKPANPEVKKYLDSVAGKKGLRVVIAGYPTWGPEGGYISVYDARPIEDVVKALKLPFA